MIFVFFFTDNIFGSTFLQTKCTFSPKYVQFFQKYSKHFCILYQISPHDIILLHHTCLWRLRQISCSSYSQLNHYLEIEWDDRHQCNCDCLLWNCKVIIAIRMVTGLCFFSLKQWHHCSCCDDGHCLCWRDWLLLLYYHVPYLKVRFILKGCWLYFEYSNIH